MHNCTLIFLNFLLFFYFYSADVETVNIPLSVYKKLIDDSVNLYKAKETIEIRTKKLQRYADEIKTLKQKRKRSKSGVSMLISYHNINKLLKYKII